MVPGLRQQQQQRPRPLALWPPAHTYLPLLDGVSCSLLQHLDGLVVVQRSLAAHHVAQELHTVQPTVGVLGSRVVHDAHLPSDSGTVWGTIRT